MKKYIIILMLFPILFAQCIKDEMPVIEATESSDIELYINEVLTTGDPDWVELYNASTEDIDISGFGVSDGPTKKYDIPNGVIIPSKGYYQFMCDKGVTGFSLSSGGEEFYIWDTEGKLVDQIAFGALDAGVSYGRTSDGGDDWANMGATPAAANSTENNPPLLTAIAIPALNDNEPYKLEVIASDADGIRDVKLFMETPNGVLFVEMAPLGGGDFVYNIPAMNAGDEVNYYIVATDETGKKTYFPETAPDTNLTLTVVDGLPVFVEVKRSTENPGIMEDINFTVTIFDKAGDTEVRIYYVLNDEVAANDSKITLTTLDNITFTGTFPGQPDGTVIHYYLRAEENAGLGQKAYYKEGINKDDETTWQTMTAAPLVLVEALVINEIQGNGAPDYIELYNGTSAEIDLSGYQLHDSDILDIYTIPGGTTIAAGAFYTLDCDGGATTAFKISSGGEDVTLLDASGTQVDQLLAVDWPEGHLGLVGRKNDAAELWGVLSAPSKGMTNN